MSWHGQYSFVLINHTDYTGNHLLPGQILSSDLIFSASATTFECDDRDLRGVFDRNPRADFVTMRQEYFDCVIA